MVLRPRRCPWCPGTWCPRDGVRPARPESRRADRQPSDLPEPPIRLGAPGRRPAAARARPTRRWYPDEQPTVLRGRWSAVVLALAALTGCVQVPTAGPIEKVEGSSRGLPELRQRRGGPAGGRRRPAADRRGIPAGHLELPAELLHRQAVPDRGGRPRSGARRRGVDLHRRIRWPSRTSRSCSTAGWSGRWPRTGPTPRGTSGWTGTSAWSRRTASGGSTGRRRD